MKALTNLRLTIIDRFIRHGVTAELRRINDRLSALEANVGKPITEDLAHRSPVVVRLKAIDRRVAALSALVEKVRRGDG